jgi:8-oxo-dGTP pyrophosphatase MutT (NUDIX family)
MDESAPSGVSVVVAFLKRLYPSEACEKLTLGRLTAYRLIKPAVATSATSAMRAASVTDHVQVDVDVDVPADYVECAVDRYRNLHINVPLHAVRHVSVRSGLSDAIKDLTDQAVTNKLYNAVFINVAAGATFDDVAAAVPRHSPHYKLANIRLDSQTGQFRIFCQIGSSPVPSGAVCALGACGIVIDPQANKVLLVQVCGSDRARFPGGSYDTELDTFRLLAHTAVRETAEETGFLVPWACAKHARLVVEQTFLSNQFAPALNKQYAFFVPGASATTLQPDAKEIDRAEWVDIAAVLRAQPGDVLPNSMRVTQGVQVGLRSALTQTGLVPITPVDAEEGRPITMCAVAP